MNVQDLANETLVQKNRRILQSKCRHEEVYSSTVCGPDGTFTTRFCLDCGKDIKPILPSERGHLEQEGK